MMFGHVGNRLGDVRREVKEKSPEMSQFSLGTAIFVYLPLVTFDETAFLLFSEC